MVFPNEATEKVLKNFPGLYYFETYRNYLSEEGEKTTFTDVMIAFTGYVVEKYIQNNEKSLLRKVFDLIEYFMINGNEEVQEVAATCFLENLINMSSHGRFAPSSFLPFLGTESKEYCKAWDKFMGVKTKGLWDDETWLEKIVSRLRP